MIDLANIERISVDLAGRGYDIFVGGGLLTHAAELMAPVMTGKRTAIITDTSVAALHLPELRKGLAAAGIDVTEIILTPGEGSKTFAVLEDVLERLQGARIERQDTLIALGGGVIGDVTGFAASILRRGLEFIQIPTTLLAQVDSSVGGKTGINTKYGKNLVGTFHQPRLVLADTFVLDTLPRRQLLAGYAEIVKYGLLGDANFFTWLEQHGKALLDGDEQARRVAISRACLMKAGIVSRDEREMGERAFLNLGHTFGHALEAAHGFSSNLLHGEAVAIGMVAAFALSAEIGLGSLNSVTRVERHLQTVGLKTRPFGASASELLELMRQDKKVVDGKMTFVLAPEIGHAVLRRDVSEGAVINVLSRLMTKDGFVSGADRM